MRVLVAVALLAVVDCTSPAAGWPGSACRLGSDCNHTYAARCAGGVCVSAIPVGDAVAYCRGEGGACTDAGYCVATAPCCISANTSAAPGSRLTGVAASVTGEPTGGECDWGEFADWGIP